MSLEKKASLIVAVTGASGAPYARRFFHILEEHQIPCEVIFSLTGKKVYQFETGEEFSPTAYQKIYSPDDLFAPPASGTYPTLGMVVLPCSMGTMSRISCGLSDTLIDRAASVTLKEKRPLVLLTRELPLHGIHLKNMVCLEQAGTCLMPLSPGFYRHPKSIEDLIDSVLDHLIRFLALPFELLPPWKNDSSV